MGCQSPAQVFDFALRRKGREGWLPYSQGVLVSTLPGSPPTLAWPYFLRGLPLAFLGLPTVVRETVLIAWAAMRACSAAAV